MDRWRAETIRKFDCFGKDGDWALLESSSKEYFAKEYMQEINQDHPLYNIGFQPIARRYSRDDVLFVLDNGKWVILHLTFSNSNLNGWLKFEIFENYNTALNYIETQYHLEIV